jgi:hypothetical protein
VGDELTAPYSEVKVAKRTDGATVKWRLDERHTAHTLVAYVFPSVRTRERHTAHTLVAYVFPSVRTRERHTAHTLVAYVFPSVRTS